MGQKVLRRRGKLLKRMRQLSYLVRHPISHARCMRTVARSRLSADRMTPFRYLGDHLALSLATDIRRKALEGHHSIASDAFSPQAAIRIRDGAAIWRRHVDDGPPLRILLQPSKLAPMEGELQLSFSFRSELYVLTFLIAPGSVFGSKNPKVLFIGGLQGRMGCVKEIREAARLNHEIAPAAMLMLAVQAVAREIGAAELIAIGEDDQVSMSYSAPMVSFDYRAFWTDVGGSRRGRFYSLPLEPNHRPLSEIKLSHRSRTRRKREEKQRIRSNLEARMRQLLRPANRSAMSLQACPA